MVHLLKPRFTHDLTPWFVLLLFPLQAAVPKYLKLEMLPPSSTTVPANSNGVVTQEIRLTNSLQGQKNLMLKLKIGFNMGGAVV